MANMVHWLFFKGPDTTTYNVNDVTSAIPTTAMATTEQTTVDEQTSTIPTTAMASTEQTTVDEQTSTIPTTAMATTEQTTVEEQTTANGRTTGLVTVTLQNAKLQTTDVEQTTVSGPTTRLFTETVMETTSHTIVEDSTTAIEQTTRLVTENITTSDCNCPCASYLNPDDPDYLEKLYAKLQSIRRELFIEQKSLSYNLRRLISAPDDRTSSKYIGVVGITVLAVVGLALIFPDIVNLYIWLRNDV